MIFFAPASSAMSINSPVPMVDAAMASLFNAPPTNVRPDALGHLDHGGASIHPPLGLYRITQRPGHDRRAVGSAQCLERALPAVGHR